LREKLRAGWKENLKKLSEHALLLGNSEYAVIKKMARNGRKTAVWSVANFGDQSLARKLLLIFDLLYYKPLLINHNECTALHSTM
jgi:hypothetical protein